jgi:hypothetical protein
MFAVVVYHTDTLCFPILHSATPLSISGPAKRLAGRTLVGIAAGAHRRCTLPDKFEQEIAQTQ